MRVRVRPGTVLAVYLATVLAAAVPGPAEAQERAAPSAEAGRRAQTAPVISPTSVTFAVPGDAASAVLTVSGPKGLYVRKELLAGQSAAFSSADAPGGRLPDGPYVWELRLAPRAVAAPSETPSRAGLALDDSGRERTVVRGQPDEAGAVSSGAFAVLAGALVGPASSGAEGLRARAPRPAPSPKSPAGPPAVQDVVVADDHIVQGSQCVGLDCVVNESFGFDTLRLKENNTRIKFDDTSTSAGFPNHDWQLTANDSASGGANKFSIEDITAATVPFTVTGSAPTNSVFVDSTGRVGFRTSTPVLDLHVTTSNTPGMRLEQTNAGGFTAQTWDVAGNEANFFVRDVTGGSRLPLRIRPGAPTSSVDINATGKVGIGTASPSFRLDVQGLVKADATVSVSTTSGTDVPTVQFRRAGPSGPAAGAVLGAVDFGGTSSSPAQADGAASVQASATEAWSGAATGTALTFWTTPNGTVSPLARVTIQQDGRVGIGTTAPQGALDVNGAIYQRGGLLHADYVFERGFPLESFEQHQSFAWTHRHLPALAPRRVDADGREVLELGAQQRGILEELEKAYLYIEQLKTSLDRLSTADRAKDDTIAALKETLERLETRVGRIERLGADGKR